MKEFGGFEAIHQRKRNILAGVEKPRNEGEHQMILVRELFIRDLPAETMHVDDADFDNRAAEYWIDREYAKAFRDLITHPDFKQRYRFHGDSLNVTLSDVEYFLYNKKLPER